MNTQTQTARHTAPNSRRANGSQTGGKPDTVARTAKASETLAARSNENEVDPGLKVETTTTLGGASSRSNISNIFAGHTEGMRKERTLKLQLLQTATQALARAVDFEKEGAAKAKEAQEAAETGGHLLYQARTSGLLSSDELTKVLGDHWGFKMKPPKEGRAAEASKTPNGGGEALRKRIVRAVSAKEFVETGLSDNRLFEGLLPDDIRPIVEDIEREAEPLSIWTAYDKIAELKRKGTTRVDPAFNPSLIAKMRDKLGEAGAASIIARSPALVAAYAALIDTLNIVGAEAAAIVAEAKAAKEAKPLPQGAVA